MKRVFHVALILWLIAAAAGCSGDAPPPTAGQPAAAAGLTGIAAPPSDAAPAEHILYAAHLVQSYYVDEVEFGALLRAAWSGLQKAAPPDAARRVVLHLPADRAGAERAFTAALATLERAAPALDRDALILAALDAMTESLDDGHTYFMEPEDYQLYVTNQTIGLGYSGLRRAGGLLVWYVYEDGPAARAGLRAGDVIRTIDGVFIAARPDEKAPELFRSGVPVTLAVDRPGTGAFEVSATPQLSQRRVLEWRRIGDVGYVRLYRFPPLATPMPDGQMLPAYLDKALAELREAGVKSWLLDLRNNPGGSEIVAAMVAGRLGLRGALVENRRRTSGGAIIEAMGDSGLAGLPLALLTNENSASSSELLTEALQQAGLARVFGAKTAGVVNTARIWAVAGGGLFVTTDRAYAGAGRRYLDREGVFPDEAVSLSRDELARGRDTQIERALEWLRSRTGAAVGGR